MLITVGCGRMDAFRRSTGTLFQLVERYKFFAHASKRLFLDETSGEIGAIHAKHSERSSLVQVRSFRFACAPPTLARR